MLFRSFEEMQAAMDVYQKDQVEGDDLLEETDRENLEAQIQVQIASEQKNIELAQKQAERTKESLRVTIVEPANAEKAKQMADADAEKYRKIAEAEARAESRKVEAQAEAWQRTRRMRSALPSMPVST